MSNCPDEKQLEELIAGTLSESAAESLTEHVGSCETCQSAMERLAEGGTRVSRLITESVAAAPPANSAYWNVRQSFSDQTPVSLTAFGNDSPQEFKDGEQIAFETADDSFAASPEERKDDLSFLEPSDDPAYIGQMHNFLVSRVIGRGGMGVVLEGFDPHLSRSVAIKVLATKLQQDKSAIERFCREGRAAAAISHEHVVQMYQVARVEEGEPAFLVMQLIKGETLEDRLARESPLEPKEVARLGMQIAAGLSAAHESGLVHRDIKPGNILIEESTKRVKLTDFGLARISDELKLTKTGMLLGTALYMSPEQALGKPVDERSDLFSLGAVMYEMATGEPAFNAPTAVGVMKRIMDETPEPPHKINPEIGKPASALIMQLISKKPEDRPDNAASVARALASIVTEHGPISPLQVPSLSSSEVRKLSTSHSAASRTWSMGGWIIASLATIGLSLIVFAGWTPWGYQAGGEFTANG